MMALDRAASDGRDAAIAVGLPCASRLFGRDELAAIPDPGVADAALPGGGSRAASAATGEPSWQPAAIELGSATRAPGSAQASRRPGAIERWVRDEACRSAIGADAIPEHASSGRWRR